MGWVVTRCNRGGERIRAQRKVAEANGKKKTKRTTRKRSK